MNVLQTMFMDELLVEQEYGDMRDKKRAMLDAVYDQGYKSFEELFGSSNDEAGDPEDIDGIELPPMNTGTRTPLPYVAPLEPTEDGFPGLEPPLG